MSPKTPKAPSEYVAEVKGCGPLYIPLRRPNPVPLHMHFRVLTPDNGVIMCSTEADATRVAYDYNQMLHEIAQLKREVARLKHPLTKWMARWA